MLNKTEQEQVVKMIEKGVSIENMKESLGKTKRSRVVEKFVEELKIELEWAGAKKDALKSLIDGGMPKEQAQKVVEETMEKIDLGEDLPEAKSILDNVRRTNVSLLKTETESGDKDRGVTAMTGSSSMSNNHSHRLEGNRHVRGGIFRPKG